MLKAVRFKNFSKFQEDTLLRFNDGGAYLFVGENNSGKSSVLKAVRRCMDMKVNFTFEMNVQNEADPAYAICDFYLPEDIRDPFQGHNRIVTSFVQLPGSNSAKVVVITDDGDSQSGVVYMDIIYRGDYVLPSKNDHCQISEKEKRTLIMNLTELVRRMDKNSDEFLNTVSNIINRSVKITTETKFTRILKNYVKSAINFGSRLIGISRWVGSFSFMKEESYNFTEAECTLEALSEHVVFTFALRAARGVQWSKSSNLRKGEDNYYGASERSEIIKWFYDRQKDDNYDTSKADEILKTLTDGESFTFDFKPSNGKELLLVQNGRMKPFSILNCPEGILEAKYVSLLLSYKPLRTLFLEEPDRGMHPQMIHRLRSIVLAAENNKTIIIISHNAAFISPLLIPRTFKFCRIINQSAGDNNGNYRFEIVNIGNIIKQMVEPIPRIGNEEYASVLYAKRVLFVEGESDYIFIRAMFSHILNPETEGSTKFIFKLVSDLNEDTNNGPLSDNEIKKLKKLLTSLYVLKLNGHGNKEKWHAFCKATNTPHLFLLDANAVVQTELSETTGSAAKIHAAGTHDKIAGFLKQKKIEEGLAEKITYFLRRKFLQEAPSLLDCQNFSDKRKNESIQQIVDIATNTNVLDENVDMEVEFGRIDATFYGKIYARKIRQWTIPQPSDFRMTQTSMILESKIVTDQGIKEFQHFLTANQWTDARNILKKFDVFVWRDGSLEDAILGVILATKAENIKTRTDEIFRKYLAFYSLNIDLPLESFRNKHSHTKLYLETSASTTNTGCQIKCICEEDILSSIDLVFKFCEKDSDIVQFLHFLTMYAMQEILS